MHKPTDRKHMTEVSYKTPNKLDVRRQTHALYTEPKRNFYATVLNQIEWTGNEVVIDVGCGSGGYTADVQERSARYIAGDLSFGMAASVPTQDRLVLDVQALPFAPQQADVVLANHMLYHVPDKTAALQAIAQVLKPDGRLIATTNSRHSMQEMYQLLDQAARILNLETHFTDLRTALAFNTENGEEILGRVFSRVKHIRLDGAFVFPKPAPLLAYINSMSEWYKDAITNGVTWSQMDTTIANLLETHFQNHDTFRINKVSSVFVAQL